MNFKLYGFIVLFIPVQFHYLLLYAIPLYSVLGGGAFRAKRRGSGGNGESECEGNKSISIFLTN